jgi:hypothetical protein
MAASNLDVRLTPKADVALVFETVLDLTSHALSDEAFRVRIGGVREMFAIRPHPHVSAGTCALLAFFEAVPFLGLFGRCLFDHDRAQGDHQRECDHDSSEHWLLHSGTKTNKNKGSMIVAACVVAKQAPQISESLNSNAPT